jgi:hypothetical protein
MMLEERARDTEGFCKQQEITEGIPVDGRHSLRWVKLADTVERSLYWLIPAATLAYLVFRILPLLGS